MLLHGALLQGGEGRRAAVIIEPAHPARIYPLLMSAYQLTERERDVTSQILRGSSTTQIATDLHISPHTVQQHLKSVFDKTGVRSRRDLVGKIFFNHYEPRIRDNEHRVLREPTGTRRPCAWEFGGPGQTLPPLSEDAALLHCVWRDVQVSRDLGRGRPARKSDSWTSRSRSVSW